MRKIASVIAALVVALSITNPLIAASPHFGNAGGIGSATSTYSAGEPTGGTYAINGSTGAATFGGILVTKGQTWNEPSVVDTTIGSVAPGNVIRNAAGNKLAYCPSLSCVPVTSGNVVHRVASALISTTTAYDAQAEEDTLAIATTINKGYSPPLTRSTAYTFDQTAVIGNAAYRATTAGTTAAASPPPGTHPSTFPFTYTDGGVTWLWVNDSAVVAKTALYNEVANVAGGGASWAQANNFILQSGHTPSFNINTELDFSNNSGKDCVLGVANCNGLFIAMQGTNKTTSGINLTGSGAGPLYGVNLSGIAANAAVEVDMSAPRGLALGVLIPTTFSIASIQDQSTSPYGVYLNGTYSNQAVYAGGTTSNSNGTGADQGQIIVSPNSGSSRLQLGYVFQAGVKEYGRIQSSNAVGSTPLVVQQGGGVTLFGPDGIQLLPTTVSALGTCNTSATGTIKYVSDAAAPAYNGTLTGGGAVKTLALCNGTNWTAH